MKAPVISIITPTFNHQKYIGFTIESVLNQIGHFYIDYVIIDGGSTDGNVDRIKHYEELLHANCAKEEVGGLTYFVNRPGSEFIRCLGISFRWVSEPDGGQADAINKGLRIAIGDIFGYLNSDDTYERNALNIITAEFKSSPETDVIYGNALYIDADNKVTGMYPPQDINTQSIDVNCVISQPSAFIRMDTVKKFGGFNANFKNSLDYEYWLRLWHGGAKFKFINPVLSSTRLHEMTKTKLNREAVNMESLAAITHYAGKVPLGAKVEFASEVSIIGKLFAYSRTLNRIAHRLIMRLYAPIYFRYFQQKVADTKTKLFSE